MTEAQTSPAPGWYPDPGGSQGQRWWDGQAWTQTVQLPTAPTPPPVIEYAMSAAVPPWQHRRCRSSAARSSTRPSRRP